jgi:hypothetical protein
MTTLPIAIAVDNRATQMNMHTFFTGCRPVEITVYDNFLHVTQGELTYTFVDAHEAWFLTAIGECSIDIKITDPHLNHLLDTYAQQTQKEPQR